MRDLNHSGFRAYSTTEVEAHLMTLMVYAARFGNDAYRQGFVEAIAQFGVAFEIPPQRIRELLVQYGFVLWDETQ